MDAVSLNLGRTAQTSQWKTVLNNVLNFLGGKVKSKTVLKEISTQSPKKGDAIKVISEDLLKNTKDEKYIEKK